MGVTRQKHTSPFHIHAPKFYPKRRSKVFWTTLSFAIIIQCQLWKNIKMEYQWNNAEGKLDNRSNTYCSTTLFTLKLVTTGRGSKTDHSLNNVLLEMIKIPQMIKKFPTVFNEGWWLNIVHGRPALDSYLPRSLQSWHINHAFLISNFRRVLNVVCFLLGNSRLLNFICQRFGTPCLFHLHR